MATEAKHTPGPWYFTLHPDGYADVQSRVLNEDNYVARVDTPNERGQANARLVSASPQLAHALADVRELLLVLVKEPDDPHRDKAWAEDALDDTLERATDALQDAAGDNWWKVLGEL